MQPNHTASARPRQSPSHETRAEFRFPDVLVPARVLWKLVAGHISKIDFAVTCVVRAYELRGGSCWASAPHIAGAVGVTAGAVRNVLSRLTAGGYLTRVYHDGQRYYRTKWAGELSAPPVTGCHSRNDGGCHRPDDTEYRQENQEEYTVAGFTGDSVPAPSTRREPHTPPATPARLSPPASRDRITGTGRTSLPAEHATGNAGPRRGLPPPAARDRNHYTPASDDNTPAQRRRAVPAPSVNRVTNPRSAGHRPPRHTPPQQEGRPVSDGLVDHMPATDRDVKRRPEREPGAVHTGMAKQHRTAVEKHGHGLARYSLRSWAGEFRIACDTYGQSRVESVLKWYHAHMVGQYIPEAWCGRSFRAKFDRIEAAMQRDRERNPDVEISKEAADIARRLDGKGWPKGSESQLPAVAQLSLDAVSAFARRLDGSADHPDRDVRRLAANLAKNDFDDHVHVVEAWLTRVFDRIKNWDDWRGTLVYFVWRPDHPDVTGTGRKLADKYTDHPDVWNDLMRVLK